jgi:hypothetical protein
VLAHHTTKLLCMVSAHTTAIHLLHSVASHHFNCCCYVLICRNVIRSNAFAHMQNLRDILRKLLKSSKSKRLGKTRGGTAAVMKHKWYRYVFTVSYYNTTADNTKHTKYVV